MTKILTVLFILALSTACIKTAEQVQREKKFDNMSEQVSDSQSLVRDLLSQMKDLQSQLDKMNGRIEELEHKQKQFNPNTLNTLNENMTIMQGHRQTDSAQLTQIQNELKEQRTFLEKVTASLNSMGASSSNQKTNKSKKKSVKQDINSALDMVSNDQYDNARTELLSLLENKDLTPGDLNKILHGLGRVEFYSKNYDQSLVYFSKIYSKYPKASLAPSSLLFIGKALHRLGKKDEAKEAFAKLTEDYPQAREVSEAKKEL